MKLFFMLLVGTFSVVFATSAIADSGTLTPVMESLVTAAGDTNAKLVSYGLKILASALVLQWVITHWKDIFNGELSSILAKSVGIITWGGISFYMLDHLLLFKDAFLQYTLLSKDISGVQFDAGSVWSNGVALQNNLVASFNKYTGSENFLSALTNIFPAMMLVIVCMLILLCYGFIAFAIFMCTAEFYFMFAVLPIIVPLISLQAFRDQGMAPIKGVIALGLRIIILGLIVKILGNVQTNAVSAFATMDKWHSFDIIFTALGGVFACAVATLSAGKIASSIASGSASFSGADAIKGGMQLATTAAVGAAAVTGGAAAIVSAGNAASKGAIGAASGAGKIAGAISGRNNLGVSPGGGAPGVGAPGGGAPVVGGPHLSSFGREQALHSKGGGDGSPASGGASGDTIGGGASAPSSGGSKSESNSGTPVTSATSATPDGGVGSSGKSSGNTAASSASGNASAAGIGGADGGSGKPPDKKPSQHAQRFGSAISQAGNMLSQDQHAVSISINARGE